MKCLVAAGSGSEKAQKREAAAVESDAEPECVKSVPAVRTEYENGLQNKLVMQLQKQAQVLHKIFALSPIPKQSSGSLCDTCCESVSKKTFNSGPVL